MDTKIVIGLGYGDEGKGLTTDYLCANSEYPLVIRFSGGHQAGHTVVSDNGLKHVFSSFGAGTLRGVPTYWSKFCTMYPVNFRNELDAILAKGIHPKFYLDAKALITTPYDILFNRKTEKINQHGSCGLGFSATIARDKDTPYKLYAQDLFHPKVLELKLSAISDYYSFKIKDENFAESVKDELAYFLEAINEILPYIDIVTEKEFFASMIKNHNYSDLIFEGSQGILLDMDHGFFPNVTYANTVSKNAMYLINKYQLDQPEIFYITRAYQTRHGNGFLSNENLSFEININPNETNQYNPWQGNQRLSVLDIDMINYALQCDDYYSYGCSKNIVITCLDQLKDDILATKGNEVYSFKDCKNLIKEFNYPFKTILESRGETSKTINSIPISGFVEINK